MDDMSLWAGKLKPIEPDETNWDFDESIRFCRTLDSEVVESGGVLLCELHRAHEILVNRSRYTRAKHIKGRGWEEFCKEYGRTRQTIYSWFNQAKLPYTKTGGFECPRIDTRKSQRKRTDRDTKIQLTETTQKIREGKVSDDDLKDHLDSVAETIEKGTSAQRVASKVVKAVKTVNRQAALLRETKEKSFLEKLNIKLQDCAEQLEYVVGGTYERAPDDQIHLKAIRHCGPGFILLFHQLGIDVRKVYETLISPERSLTDDRGSEDRRTDVIDVRPNKEA